MERKSIPPAPKWIYVNIVTEHFARGYNTDVPQERGKYDPPRKEKMITITLKYSDEDDERVFTFETAEEAGIVFPTPDFDFQEDHRDKMLLQTDVFLRKDELVKLHERAGEESVQDYVRAVIVEHLRAVGDGDVCAFCGGDQADCICD